MTTFNSESLYSIIIFTIIMVAVVLIRERSLRKQPPPTAPTTMPQPVPSATFGLPSRMPAPPTHSLPYARTAQLLTPAEVQFFTVLQAALPPGLLIFPQVRLAGLVHTTERRERQRKYDFYRIQAKTVDFVLCDAVTSAARLVVELDDSSHQQNHRKHRDAFVDDVLASVGLPILHIPWARSYDRATLAQAIHTALGLPPALPSPQPAYMPAPVTPIAIAPAPIQPAAPIAVSPPTPHQIVAPPAFTQRIMCGECGAEVRAESQFCWACGATLSR